MSERSEEALTPPEACVERSDRSTQGSEVAHWTFVDECVV